jgi:hypothetical protein
MFNQRYNHVIGISTLLGLFGVYRYMTNENKSEYNDINTPVEIYKKRSLLLASYSNKDNDDIENYSEYDDSSDSELSEDFNLRSYALTEYEYY